MLVQITRIGSAAQITSKVNVKLNIDEQNAGRKNKSYGQRPMPAMDEVNLGISVQEMLEWLAEYDERRAMLSRDGLASVYGFRLTILLDLEYIMGSEFVQCVQIATTVRKLSMIIT